MFKRDYFMRQIEQLALVLHHILFHKEQKQFEDAERLLDEACRHILGLNLRSLRALSIPDILKLLTYNEITDTGKALVLADLLKEEGDLHQAQDNPYEAYISRVKALDLLLNLHQDYRDGDELLDQELKTRIDDLLAQFGKLDLPIPVKEKLLAYYEEGGAYAKVEDVLFHLLEDEPGRAGIREFGISFYQRLLGKETAQLARGNFSREEASEGLSLMQQE
ncbi:DUF6483 family protein [Paenibacillus sp. GP183]|uniref:DUF6483 family protein n=1 Tax=Paenibacillus sp. GP183 TaxID=1882751 RepID=UPI0008943AAA|nr:DUF6483 family protein [Paenibacillus sp. GP183]SEC70949.1 hypothetical protein SAMN05443246_5086 [Paenibacillus sp. GP183]